MCLILLAKNYLPGYRLIIAANRDEFYDRPTAPARFWDDSPDILAGRDLALGGTWLGISRSGKFAAVTNYRDMTQPKGSISRGFLVSDFLSSDVRSESYLEQVASQSEKYTGFNLLFGELSDPNPRLFYLSNKGGGTAKLTDGVFGLSNAFLETPWHKVIRGKELFTGAIQETDGLKAEKLLEILNDRTPATEDLLPETGIGIERERILSPMFIETPVYGTRSSAVITVDDTGLVNFTERSIHPNLPVSSFSFMID